MDPQWFYQINGRQGPVDTAALFAALVRTADPRAVKVWREGFPDWVSASDVAELAGKLPPPAPDLRARTSSDTITSQAEAVAKHYRSLILLLGLQVLLVLLLQVIAAPAVAVAALAGLMILALMLSVAAYRLMSGLGAGAPILWAIGIFVPLVSLLVLAAISSRAQEWCKRHQIKVGFWGPTRESISELRIRSQA